MTAAAPARRLVVGYEGGTNGADAIAFGRRWSALTGDALLVVTVHPGPAPLGAGRVDVEWAAYEREQADLLLDQARALVPDGVPATFRRVDAGSAAHGLHDLAAAQPDAVPLVVLGSGRSRGMRRTYPGTTAERLLQGSPVPVAMVPYGWSEDPEPPLATVTAAFVDTPDGHVALQWAAGTAAHLGAQLRVLSVVPDTRVLPSLGDPRQFGTEQAGQYRAAVDAAAASVAATVQATGELRPGPVVDALTELRPGEHDLLVVGSRGYGPLRSVLLGGVSARVVRHSRVPVVVVPRAG